MITLALWLLRFAMSSTWLYWLATWFRPLFEVLRNLLVDLYVFPICLVLGIAVGAYHLIVHGRRGSGWGIMLTTFMIGIIGIILTKDPLTELYSDNGLLNQGRNLGFTVAQAAMNNGAIAPGGSQGQLSHLTAGSPMPQSECRCRCGTSAARSTASAAAAAHSRTPSSPVNPPRPPTPWPRQTADAVPPKRCPSPAPRRQHRRHRVLVLGARRVLDHLHQLRHLQLHHGVRGRVPQRHHGPVRRRPRHDQRPPPPPRRPAATRVLPARLPRLRLRRLHLIRRGDHAQDGRTRWIRRPGRHDPPRSPARAHRVDVGRRDRPVLVAQKGARRPHPPGPHPRRDQPRSSRPIRIRPRPPRR